jgi:hypothetical protein
LDLVDEMCEDGLDVVYVGGLKHHSDSFTFTDLDDTAEHFRVVVTSLQRCYCHHLRNSTEVEDGLVVYSRQICQYVRYMRQSICYRGFVSIIIRNYDSALTSLLCSEWSLEPFI